MFVTAVMERHEQFVERAPYFPVRIRRLRKVRRRSAVDTRSQAPSAVRRQHRTGGNDIVLHDTVADNSVPVDGLEPESRRQQPLKRRRSVTGVASALDSPVGWQLRDTSGAHNGVAVDTECITVVVGSSCELLSDAVPHGHSHVQHQHQHPRTPPAPPPPSLSAPTAPVAAVAATETGVIPGGTVVPRWLVYVRCSDVTIDVARIVSKVRFVVQEGAGDGTPDHRLTVFVPQSCLACSTPLRLRVRA
jgi:hypothetical protein